MHCNTTLASNGEEAIKIVTEKDCNLMLIDVIMPFMNALEIYQVFRKIRPCIKVVMITALRQETQNLLEEAIRQNVYACLCKLLNTQKRIAAIEGKLAAKAKAEIQLMGGDKKYRKMQAF